MESQGRRGRDSWLTQVGEGKQRAQRETEKLNLAILERKHRHASPAAGPGSSLLGTQAPPRVASSCPPATSDISKVNSTRQPCSPPQPGEQPAHFRDKD